MMWAPTIEDILAFHTKLTMRTGGSDGVRSLPLVESALCRFDASFGGVEMYETIEEKAAAVGCGLIQNHAFLDGNKRIGIAVMLLILRKNGIVLRYTQQELIDLVMSAARSESDVEDFVRFIQLHR